MKPERPVPRCTHSITSSAARSVTMRVKLVKATNGSRLEALVGELARGFLDPEQSGSASGCAVCHALKLIGITLSAPRPQLRAIEFGKPLHGAELCGTKPPSAAGEKRLTHVVSGAADLLGRPDDHSGEVDRAAGTRFHPQRRPRRDIGAPICFKVQQIKDMSLGAPYRDQGTFDHAGAGRQDLSTLKRPRIPSFHPAQTLSIFRSPNAGQSALILRSRRAIRFGPKCHTATPA